MTGHTVLRYWIALLSALVFVPSANAGDRLTEKKQSVSSSFVPVDYSLFVFVEAQVYGRDGREEAGLFVLDTGTEVSELDESVVDSLNLKIAGQGNVGSVSGNQIQRKALVPRICLDRVCRHAIPVFVRTTKNSLESQKGAIGTLGADFLNSSVVTLDYRNRRMALTVRPPRMPNYRTILAAPIAVINGLPFVECDLPTIKSCNLLIDTGNAETVIFGSDVAKFVHLDSVTRTTDLVGPAGRTPIEFGPIGWMLIAGTLKLSPVTIGLCRHQELQFPVRSKYRPGLLGNGVLSSYVLQIRYQEKTVRFLRPRK